jgi:hypothetical protein
MSLPIPETLRLGKSEFSLYYERDYTYDDVASGIKQHLSFGVVSFGDGQREPDGSVAVGYYLKADDFPEKALAAIVQFKSLLNTCINHAERINSAFSDITKSLPGYTPAEEQRINTTDFMNLKDGLMKYTKSKDSLRELANKSFRRSLDNFITYRNIFTHGTLCVVCTPEGKLLDSCVLRYIDKHTKMIVITKVSKELIENYIQTYAEILAFNGALKAVIRG